MYIATVPNRNSPPAILLRESYREEGKVRTRTIANLSSFSPLRIEALRRAFKGEFDSTLPSTLPVCGEIFGTFFALKKLADEMGLTDALGQSRPAKLALFLVLCRIAHPSSRLSAVRFAKQHALSDILGLESFDEDDLYAALDWLAEQQDKLEHTLYQQHVKRAGKPPALVLYDVTSSYFEGTDNELASYGYNRDGKRGKKQIVIGLLTDIDGEPLAIRVFKGNTADPSTVVEQINVLKNQFAIQHVIFVGDRGMVKKKGQEALTQEDFDYITTLTDAQVRTLLNKEVLQIDLFDSTLTEVEADGKRYVLRRNEAVRQKEAHRVEDKLCRLKQLIEARNEKVTNAPRASAEKGLLKLEQWIKSYKLHTFVTITLDARMLHCCIDEASKAKALLLAGCYVMETNVKQNVLNAEEVDTSYRNLQRVERDFRALKTGFLEIRPIYVRKKIRTEGHVFVAMLALKVLRCFEGKLQTAFGTTDENPHTITPSDALVSLSRIVFLRYTHEGNTEHCLPQPDEEQRAILKALGITLPRRKH